MSEQKRGYMQEVDEWLTAVLITRVDEGETNEQWLTPGQGATGVQVSDRSIAFVCEFCANTAAFSFVRKEC